MNVVGERWSVSRVIKIGRALYVGISAETAKQAGVKKGDRLGVTVEGRTVVMERIPFEELATRLRGKRAESAVAETLTR